MGSARAPGQNDGGLRDEHVATWVRLQSKLVDRGSWWRLAQFGNATCEHLGGGTSGTEDPFTLAAKAVVAAFMLGPANEYTDRAAADVRAAAGGRAAVSEAAGQLGDGAQPCGQERAAAGQSGDPVAPAGDGERVPEEPSGPQQGHEWGKREAKHQYICPAPGADETKADGKVGLVRWMEHGLDLAGSPPVHHYRCILSAGVAEMGADGEEDGDDVQMPAVLYSEEFGGVLNLPASWWLMFPSRRRFLKRRRPRYWETA